MRRRRSGASGYTRKEIKTSDKEQPLVLEGTVLEKLPDAYFKVQVSETHVVLARISGRMARASIKVLVGDKVKMEVSPYDPSRGRITYRFK